MTTRIAFLRAVNVGRRTVPMSRLVEVFGALGYEGAWTHINSGNVVFEATAGRAALERTIEEALESTFGFEVTTFAAPRSSSTRPRTSTRSGWRRHTCFVTFLKEVPPAATARPWRRPRTTSTPGRRRSRGPLEDAGRSTETT
jgi:hypothetical protein